jgi:hypothetical protein
MMTKEEIRENIRLAKIAVASGPSILTKIKAAGSSGVKWAGSGFKRVQQHIYESRLAICRECSFWEERGNLGMGKCLKCGCGRGKHWLPHEKCPIDKWGKEPLTPPASV